MKERKEILAKMSESQIFKSPNIGTGLKEISL